MQVLDFQGRLVSDVPLFYIDPSNKTSLKNTLRAGMDKIKEKKKMKFSLRPGPPRNEPHGPKTCPWGPLAGVFHLNMRSGKV